MRAGRHFYSDIFVGSLVGIGVGYAVPALHATGSPYVPSTADLAAAGGGVLAGVLASELIPLESSVHVAPVAVKDGAGFGFAGAF